MPAPDRRRLTVWAAVFLALAAAACGGGDAGPPTVEQDASIASPTPGPSPESIVASPTRGPTPGPVVATASPPVGRTLASGELSLPAAAAFGEPGFHEVLTAVHSLPEDLGDVSGRTLVLRLWDAGRPDVACSTQHPLSGCATVDWSDAPGRPNVPAGGVFRNAVTLRLASGEHTLFLSDSGGLRDDPDPFKPG